MSLKKKLFLLVLLIALGYGVFLLANPTSRTNIRHSLESAYAHISSGSDSAFPEIEMDRLTETQRKVVNLTYIEYAKKPVSYDQSVLKYTDNNKEPWCADFTSWIMQQAGVAYSNPNSGNWRIPGVLTLKEYYESEGRYIKTNDSYVPRVGDVAIYTGKNTLEGRNGQHANIVLSIMGDKMTTIGGNERGRMRVSISNFKSRENGLVGFGTLPVEQK